MGYTSRTVLFAGADTTDRGILQYAQRQAGTSLKMIFMRTPAEVIAYLIGEGRFADRHLHPLPEILILDLLKPRMNRWELLDWLKARPELSHIQLCFIGAEDDRITLRKAKSHGRCFFTKPEDLESYKKLLLSLNAEKAAHASH